MPDLFFGTSGPKDADIAVVAESWGTEEKYQQAPLVGASGQEFRRILSDANIDPRSVFMTNVCSDQPPGNNMEEFFEPTKEATLEPIHGLFPSMKVRMEIDRMFQQLDTVRPKVVIAVGAYSMWALTNCGGYGPSSSKRYSGIRVPTGITSWRGSQEVRVQHGIRDRSETNLPVLPIIHPAAILRQWSQREITVHDLRVRVPLALSNNWSPPQVTTLVPPTFQQLEYHFNRWLSTANKGELLLSVDVETSPRRGLMTCMGFGDQTFAMVVPLVRPLPDGRIESFWSIEEEAKIIGLVRRLFLHPNVGCIGQNFIYDMQWFQAFFGVTPRLAWDTMLMQHLFLPGLPKDLAYLSSCYCRHHRYWKDDNKEWDLKGDLQTHLEYNAEDIWRTFEIYLELRRQLEKHNLIKLWQEELEANAVAYRMMRRGVAIDLERRRRLQDQLLIEDIPRIQNALLKIVPQEFVQNTLKSKSFWFDSPKQTAEIFYEHFRFKEIKHRKTGSITTGKEALNELREKNPEFGLLFDLLEANRSAGIFLRNFIRAPLDSDNRMRCSFNPAGAETFRWSSSENAFGRGTNLQNIPKGEED